MTKLHAREKYTIDEKISIVKRYLSGEKRNELAFTEGLSPSTITNWVKKFQDGSLFMPFKEKKRNRLSNEQKMKAVQDLMNGMSLKDVEEKYNTNNVTLYNFMKKNSIEYRSNHGRKNKFNEKFFSKINNQKKAYWLGFIMADGCISKVSEYDKKPNRLTINISSKDRTILEMFCDDIGLSQNCIYDYIPHDSTYGSTSMSKVVLNSVSLVSDLLNLGFSENKTGREFIPNIKENLIRHFIRGFFDGDGNISTDYSLFRITTCTAMADELREIISYQCNIKKYPHHLYPHKTCDIVDVAFHSRSNLNKIRKYLYTNANRFLPRKKERFDYYKGF